MNIPCPRIFSEIDNFFLSQFSSVATCTIIPDRIRNEPDHVYTWCTHPLEQAKSAEVSAAKQRNREQDLEPTERDYDGNKNVEDGAEETRGSAGGIGKERGGGSKKRRRDAPADSSRREEDLDRLKKGFLGGSKAGKGGKGGKGGNGVVSSAADFVQPKKKAQKAGS